MGSRKVGLGLWLFIVANAYLVLKLISSPEWFTSICLVTALIGGGTWVDGKLSIERAKIDKSNG